MVYRKIKYKIIGYSCLCVLFLFSCKKESKDPIYVTKNAILAHNNQPVSGIKWTITETKTKGFSGKTETTDWERSGQTDANGVSWVEFYPKNNLDYAYDIYFDYTTMNVPSGDYSIVSGPSSFAHVSKLWWLSRKITK